MKTYTNSVLQFMRQDRWLLVLSVVNIVVMLLIIVSFAVTIRPRETQVIVQHSAFSLTGLYRGYWYSLWGYGVLQFVMSIGHIFLASKLASMKLRELALVLLWLTIGLSIILALFAHSVIRVASVG